MHLSRAQMLAATHQNGPCLVLAGPGSGKTSTLIRRIEYLIMDCHVKPDEILMLTFTKASANEMQNRCKVRLKEEASRIFFGTFHSFFFHILQWSGKWCAADIVREEDWQMFHSGESQEAAYEEWKQSAGKLDYSDMESQCLEILSEQPGITRHLQEKYRYIMIDEFQDISKIQYDILRLLTGEKQNLFAVGDDDQAIYGFRGSTPDIMLELRKSYPDLRICRLETNYRCPPEIVDAAASLISHNRRRYRKHICSAKEYGNGKVCIVETATSLRESIEITERIRLLRKQGVPDAEIAVFARVREDLRRVADMCKAYQVPYRIEGEIPSVQEHFIFQDLWSYLMLASGSRERKYLLRILNRPQRYLSPACVEKPDFCFGELISWYGFEERPVKELQRLEQELDRIGQMAPYMAIHYICRKLGYMEFLQDYAIGHGIEPGRFWEILKEIMEYAKHYASIEEWKYAMEQQKENGRSSTIRENGREEGIRLMTMHGAKGLEFSHVFMIGVNEFHIPSARAVSEKQLEEERRLFYVALTRAKKEVTICYAKERNGKPATASRFLKEIKT